jgi:hypothetical protein
MLAETYHIRLRLKGSNQAKNEFNQLLKFCDTDWPYLNDPNEIIEDGGQCTRCGGMVYHRPMLAPQDIKAAAKQAGLRKVRIDKFAPATKCAPLGHGGSLGTVPA